MKRTIYFTIGLVMIVSSAAIARAQALSGEEIMRRSYLARYYPGEDMSAHVIMRLVSEGGQERVREFIMSRRNLKEGGEQRYFLYFHRPPDVRGTAFLVWAYPRRDDDRWLYVPALNLIRRIAASDKYESFVGSDFTYEDVAGREPEEDTHRVLREEKAGGRDAYILESIPKNPGNSDFSRKLSWIDKTTWLPLKEEYYDRRGDLARVFTADELKEIQGFWTMTKRVMKNAQSGHWTEVIFSEVRYNRKLSPELFSERSLRAPPAEFTK
ncbi:MAG: outer membrane lipoprotein-sorting protein [Nitrospirae bacterium]|nr:outer membrane lipoprotein-sorting protein [Nitrospirota bacterium]